MDLLVLKAWARDTLERAGKTFVQVFVLQLIASGWFTVDGMMDISTPKKALIAAGGAGLSVLSSALSVFVGPHADASIVNTTPASVVPENPGDVIPPQ